MAPTTQATYKPAPPMPLGKGWREILAVVSICAAILGISYLRTYSVTRQDAIFREPWDHQKYIYMAQHNPLDFHIAPFSWRFLNPLLASLFPFDVDTNFLVLTLIEIMLVGMMVYLMLKAAGFGQMTALTGLFFYLGLTQAIKEPLYMVWLSDPLTHLILVSAVYLILIRRPGWASVLLAVGCCAKEVVILAAPLYYLLTAERILDWKRLREGILFAFPPVAVYLGIRVLIPEMGSDPLYTSKLPYEVASAYNGGLGFGYWESAKVVIAAKLKIAPGWQLRALTVNTFGLLCLLPFFAIRENRITALRWAPFFAAVYASMILFSGSYERPLVICFPGVLIMALHGVERLRAIAGASSWWPLALAMALVPVNWLYPKRVDPLFEVQALIFIVFLAAMLHGRKDRLARV